MDSTEYMKGDWMTGRERILTAIDVKVPDRVPIFEFLEGKRIFNPDFPYRRLHKEQNLIV